jgi:hypothetical protein
LAYVPGGVKITNICPVDIEITSIRIILPNGTVQTTPSPSNCSVPADHGWNVFNTGGQPINGGPVVFR